MPPQPGDCPIRSLYRVNDSGVVVVYAGELNLSTGGRDLVVPGDLVADPGDDWALHAHVEGPFRELEPLSLGAAEVTVSLPRGATLDPPDSSAVPTQEPEVSWATHRLRVTRMHAGDLSSVESVRLHILEPFDAVLERPVTATTPGLRFLLPGWNLLLVDCAADGSPVRYVIDAQPTDQPIDTEALGALRRRLFFLLSLVTSREVGIGPVCGLDGDGNVAWAEWGSPRFRPSEPAVRWCPPDQVATALPTLASNYLDIAEDPAYERVLDRALGYLLVADGSEVLDVRIPIACAGLELLSWAFLQRDGWTGSDSVAKLSAGGVARLALRAAGIPLEIPDTMEALRKRRDRIGQADWAGPETIFNVRNGLLHPPKRVDAPEWPGSDELIESWQLATWYLELSVLHALGFNGNYGSRLKLDRWVGDVEPVPWAMAAL